MSEETILEDAWASYLRTVESGDYPAGGLLAELAGTLECASSPSRGAFLAGVCKKWLNPIDVCLGSDSDVRCLPIDSVHYPFVAKFLLPYLVERFRGGEVQAAQQLVLLDDCGFGDEVVMILSDDEWAKLWEKLVELEPTSETLWDRLQAADPSLRDCGFREALDLPASVERYVADARKIQPDVNLKDAQCEFFQRLLRDWKRYRSDDSVESFHYWSLINRPAYMWY